MTRGPRVRGLVAYRRALLHTQAQAARYYRFWRLAERLHDAKATEVALYVAALVVTLERERAQAAELETERATNRDLQAMWEGIPHNPL